MAHPFYFLRALQIIFSVGRLLNPSYQYYSLTPLFYPVTPTLYYFSSEFLITIL